MNAASSAIEIAPRTSVCGRPPTDVGDVEDRVDAEHQPGDEQDRAGDVGPLVEADPGLVVDQPHREERGEDPDRDVDEEDPVPADRLGQDATGEQADRPARGGDETVDADRFRLLARLGEHRHDHPQHDGRGQGPGDALDEPGRDQHPLGLGECAEQRGEDEDGQAGEKDPALADQVAEPPDQQQQPSEWDQVGVDDPGEAALTESEVVLDRGQRDVHDRDVENDHQDAGAEHVQREPATAVFGGGHGSGH